MLPDGMSAHIPQALFRRDRLAVLAGLAGVVALSWAYLVYLAIDMQMVGMEMSMPRLQTWNMVDFVLTFVMWTVMMVGMMVPSAIPMLLTFTTFSRRRHEGQNPFYPTALFLAGYLLTWIGFSAIAATAQWFLHSAALLSPMMVSTSPILGGSLLVAAGVFQWSPLKYACLTSCRTPLGFFMTEWSDGGRGALIMGLRHGRSCVGCCWMIMALLFVAGVMNLLWVAVIAGFVLLEKVVPKGEWVSRFAGVLLTIWGVWLIMGALT